MVTYRQMQKDDIERVIPLFIKYWNSTGDDWTPELVYSRVWQVLGAPDSYCMITEDGKQVVGFAMGQMETFNELTAYNLSEIIVAMEYQNKGFGTLMMAELESRVKQLGASMILLKSVNDDSTNIFTENLVITMQAI